MTKVLVIPDDDQRITISYNMLFDNFHVNARYIGVEKPWGHVHQEWMQGPMGGNGGGGGGGGNEDEMEWNSSLKGSE